MCFWAPYPGTLVQQSGWLCLVTWALHSLVSPHFYLCGTVATCAASSYALASDPEISLPLHIVFPAGQWSHVNFWFYCVPLDLTVRTNISALFSLRFSMVRSWVVFPTITPLYAELPFTMLVPFFSERLNRTHNQLLQLSAFLPNAYRARTIWLSSFYLCWTSSQQFVFLMPSPQICSVGSPTEKNISSCWGCQKNQLFKQILSTVTQPRRNVCWGPCAREGRSQPPPPELCVFVQVCVQSVEAHIEIDTHLRNKL